MAKTAIDVPAAPRRLGEITIPVAASELPIDYDGYLPPKVMVTLRPALRRKSRALFDALAEERATITNPRGGEMPESLCTNSPMCSSGYLNESS